MSLGPITWDEQTKMAALVQAAKTILDLGVIPVRVWRLVAHCVTHGRVIDELTIPLPDQPPSTLTCHLCVIAKVKEVSPEKNAVAALLRG